MSNRIYISNGFINFVWSMFGANAAISDSSKTYSDKVAITMFNDGCENRNLGRYHFNTQAFDESLIWCIYKLYINY